jgi:hypothetical protein
MLQPDRQRTLSKEDTVKIQPKHDQWFPSEGRFVEWEQNSTRYQLGIFDIPAVKYKMASADSVMVCLTSPKYACYGFPANIGYLSYGYVAEKLNLNIEGEDCHQITTMLRDLLGCKTGNESNNE